MQTLTSHSAVSRDCGGRLSSTALIPLFGLLAALLWPAEVRSQATGCDQGVVRLPDSTGTVTIC